MHTFVNRTMRMKTKNEDCVKYWLCFSLDARTIKHKVCQGDLRAMIYMQKQACMHAIKH